MHVLSTTTEKRRNIRLLEATIALPLSPCCNRLNPKYGRTDRHHQPSKFSFFIALSYFAIIRFALPLPHYHSVCLSVSADCRGKKGASASHPPLNGGLPASLPRRSETCSFSSEMVKGIEKSMFTAIPSLGKGQMVQDDMICM